MHVVTPPSQARRHRTRRHRSTAVHVRARVGAANRLARGLADWPTAAMTTSASMPTPRRPTTTHTVVTPVRVPAEANLGTSRVHRTRGSVDGTVCTVPATATPQAYRRLATSRIQTFYKYIPYSTAGVGEFDASEIRLQIDRDSAHEHELCPCGRRSPSRTVGIPTVTRGVKLLSSCRTRTVQLSVRTL